jgi:hypothetical protein
VVHKTQLAARTAAARGWWMPATVCLVLLCSDPALANKFETIGSGLSGSSSIKREWLQYTFMVAGGLSLLGVVLAVAFPHQNALYLNYGNWKTSAIVLGTLATLCFTVAVLI